MKDTDSAQSPEKVSKADGLSISFDEETGVLTLKWDKDSPYAAWCKAVEKDNSLLWALFENYLEYLEING